MKIYTRGGDKGETGTLGSERVPKNHIRMAACGDVDELNSVIGVVLAGQVAPEVAMVLQRVQPELFVLGAALAGTSADHPNIPRLTLEHVGRLEVDIDRLSANLEDLTAFIIPAGDLAACQLHFARAVCRRAERCIVSLSHEHELDPACLGYINRLSDLLFTMARYQNNYSGRSETLWQG